MAQGNHTSDRSGEDGEAVFVIGIITIIVFFVIIWFRFRAEIVAAVKWIYGLIASPFYVVSTITGTTIASAILCFAILGAMVVWIIKDFKQKKDIDSKIGIAVVMGLWGVTELVLPQQSSLLQAPINYLCQPDSSGSLFPLTACSRDTGTVSFLELVFASIAVNMLFGVKRIVEAVGGFARIANQHPDNKFKRVHTVDSFIEELKVIEPHLRIFSSINPNLYEGDEGMLRNMDGSRRFCYRENLISNFRVRQELPDPKLAEEKQLKEQSINDVTVNANDLVPQLNEKRLIEVMTQQLGDVWIGVDNLSPAEVILMALTVPKVASYDESMSNEEFKKIQKDNKEMLEYMCDWVAADQYRTYKDGEVDEGLAAVDRLDEFRELVRKYIDYKDVQEVIKKHAYNRTVIFSMFTKARGLGILPPCEIRWLLLYDRTLWYTIQNIDRPSFACEGLGASSHWVMETFLGVALPQPSFDVAFFGLSDQLADFKYTEEDMKDWEYHKSLVKQQKTIDEDADYDVAEGIAMEIRSSVKKLFTESMETVLITGDGFSSDEEDEDDTIMYV